MIPFPHLPLAAGLDWLEALLPILFVGFWVLSQIVAIGRKIVGPPAETGRANRPATPQPPVIRRRRPRADGEERPGHAGNLESFGDRQGEVQREIREFLERASSPPVAKPAVRPPRPVSPAVDQSKKSQSISSMSEKVQADFAKELQHLSSPLTSELLAGDPSLDGSRATTVADGRAKAARDIRTMLRSPETLRQLVVLREILDRPVDRW
jgi:hypothetical protein